MGASHSTDEALASLLDLSGGDARQALNILEAAASVAPDGVDIGPEAVAEAAQQRLLAYDRVGDQHYEAASAFIKSMRGNDPDAALYWCASMVAAGEDPTFIARRIVIAASEDVGNADPRALQVAVSAMQAVEMIGLPEAQYALAQAAAYVASAPKSNRAGAAYFSALADVEEKGACRCRCTCGRRPTADWHASTATARGTSTPTTTTTPTSTSSTCPISWLARSTTSHPTRAWRADRRAAARLRRQRRSAGRADACDCLPVDDLHRVGGARHPPGADEAIGLVLIGLLATGTVFYTLIERWDPLDALYFSVTTLATVGYGTSRRQRRSARSSRSSSCSPESGSWWSLPPKSPGRRSAGPPIELRNATLSGSRRRWRRKRLPRRSRGRIAPDRRLPTAAQIRPVTLTRIVATASSAARMMARMPMLRRSRWT